MRPNRVVAAATLALFLCGLAWIVALAPYTGIDEFDHTFRADSVGQGHWQPGNDPVPPRLGRGDLIAVHEDIAAGAREACLRLPYTGAYNCTPVKALKNGNVLIASSAARYNPVYYLMVGELASPFDGNSELYAIRLFGLLACALLFATALRSILLISPTRSVVVALAIGVLPTTVYSAAVAAPNGIQMLAGLTTWATLLALVHSSSRPRWLYPAAVTAVVLLTCTHSLGCLWLGLICVAVALHAGLRRTVRQLTPRSLAEGIGFAVALASTLFALAWIHFAGSVNIDNGSPQLSLTSLDLARQVILWPIQAVAAYPMRDNPGPVSVYALTAALIGVLVIMAGRSALTDRAVRRTMTFCLAMSLTVPVVATAASYASAGFLWQGRYGMPFSVGFFVMLALALDRNSTGRQDLTWYLPPLGVVWVTAQLIGAHDVGSKQREAGYFDNLRHWVGPPLVIVDALGLCAVIALVGLAVLERRSHHLIAPAQLEFDADAGGRCRVAGAENE